MRALTALTLLALLSQSARADEFAAPTDVESPTLRLTGGVFNYTQSMAPVNPTGPVTVDGFVDGRSPNYGHLDDAMAELSLDGVSTATPGHRTRAAEPHAAATRDGFRPAGVSTDFASQNSGTHPHGSPAHVEMAEATMDLILLCGTGLGLAVLFVVGSCQLKVLGRVLARRKMVTSSPSSASIMPHS
jgi:hypothetical protein